MRGKKLKKTSDKNYKMDIGIKRLRVLLLLGVVLVSHFFDKFKLKRKPGTYFCPHSYFLCKVFSHLIIYSPTKLSEYEQDFTWAGYATV